MKNDNILLYGTTICLCIGIVAAGAVAPLPIIKEEYLLYDEGGKTWVRIRPIQCQMNPWELDWKENYDYNEMPPMSELIRSYYQRFGVKIHDIKAVEWGGEMCLACTCKGGYVYLLVYDFDVSKMEEFGYEVFE
jgi:hypothetical protein